MLRLRRTKRHPTQHPLRVFPSAHSFARHMIKHVFGPGEREHWGQVFDLRKPPWRTLAKKRDADALLGARENAAQAAYDAFADAVDAGLAYALDTPAWIRLVELLTGLGEERRRSLYWLLSKEGFLVCARGGAVRSAFFCVDDDDRDASPANRYRHGLRALRVRAMRAAAGKREYLSSDNRWAVAVALEEHVVDGYRNTANPWRQPPPANPPEDRPRDDGDLLEWLDWLDGLDGIDG